jgi:hypothetical protein
LTAPILSSPRAAEESRKLQIRSDLYQQKSWHFSYERCGILELYVRGPVESNQGYSEIIASYT